MCYVRTQYNTYICHIYSENDFIELFTRVHDENYSNELLKKLTNIISSLAIWFKILNNFTIES